VDSWVVKRDRVPILILLALSGIFFANVLFTTKVLVTDNLVRYPPWTAYAGDDLQQTPVNYVYDRVLGHAPARLIVAEIVRSGNWPLWNPYMLCGVPLLATEVWLGLFYPLNIIFYLTNPLRAFGYVSFLDLFLGGVFMYYYLRSIELDKVSALVGAVGYEFSGYFLGNLTWLFRISAGIWTPLIFLSFEKLLRTRRWVYGVLGAFALAMCVLAGNMAVTIYIMFAFGLYCLFRLALVLRDKSLKQVVRCSILLVPMVVGGSLLSAVQVIPTFEALGSLGRAEIPYEERIEPGRSPLALGTAFIPDLFGNPVDQPWGRNAFGKNLPGTYAETNVYAGVLPLFLASWGLVQRKHRYTLFFAGLTLLSVCIFVETPLFRLLYWLFPFRVGRQLEVKVVYAFALSVLAGMGFSSLTGLPSARDRAYVGRAKVGLFTVAVIVTLTVGLGWLLIQRTNGLVVPDLAEQWYLYNIPNLLRFALLMIACGVLLLFLHHRLKLGPYLFVLLAIGLTVADLFYFGWKLNPPQNSAALYPQADSIRFLQADHDIYRIMRGPLSRKVFPPNTPEVFGVSDAQGYTSLPLSYYAEFMRLIESDIAGTRRIYSLRYPASLSSKLLDLLNVKYVMTIADPGEEMARVEQTDKNIDLVYDAEVKIYENRDVLPRAFFVSEYRVVQDGVEGLGLLSSDDFEPTTYVILEKEPDPLTPSIDAELAQPHVEILDYAPNKVIIRAASATGGFVVLSDLYYHGWKAFVDGVPQEVYKADYAFRAVQLEAGEHHIEFVFDPLSFRVGATVSLGTLSLVAILTVVVLSRRARK